MGYSHQQLKLIKQKYKLIEAAEQELERLMKKIKRQEMAGSAYVQKSKKAKKSKVVMVNSETQTDQTNAKSLF